MDYNNDICCGYQSKRCVAPLVNEIVGFLEFLEIVKEQKQSGQSSTALDREVLFQARQARRNARLLIAQFLHHIKYLKNTNTLEQIFKDTIAQIAQSGRVSVKDIVSQLDKSEEIKRLVDESGVSPAIIATLRDQIEQTETFTEVEDEHLTIWNDGQVTSITIASLATTQLGDLLKRGSFDTLAEGFAVHGRFLTTVIPGLANQHEEVKQRASDRRVVGLLDIVVNASVWLMREFDRQVRELEDVGGLAVESGGNGATAATILLVGGMIALLAAGKTDDPTLKLLLRILGTALLFLGGAVATDAGIPTTSCYITETGEKICIDM